MINAENQDAKAWFFIGVSAMQSDDLQVAEISFLKSLQIDPYFAEAYANLGLIFDKQGAKNFAEECYRCSIEINPDYSENHLNLGVLLANQKSFDEAESCYRKALNINKYCSISWSNLGVLYACTKREIEAEECYRTAISLNPSYAMVRFNLSYLLLRQGRFDEGWLCLESRNWYESINKHLICQRWKGESLYGRTILISYEGGYGDVIQFCRYVSLLKAEGATFITIICHPPLKKLLKSLEGLDCIISFDEEFSNNDWDFWTPLMSIPCYCKTRLNNIPNQIPYLAAQPYMIEDWAINLPRTGLNIGLSWHGNPLFENDSDRSLSSLQVLAPLWSVSNVNFISLQKDTDEIILEDSLDRLPLIHTGDHLRDFSDTAALIMNLDLVISVDTAVAHLAGALGKPCWVLLPEYKTDWRWLKDRADSPWYPNTMRLFRQSKMGDWNNVINDVVVALNQFVS